MITNKDFLNGFLLAGGCAAKQSEAMFEGCCSLKAISTENRVSNASPWFTNINFYRTC